MCGITGMITKDTVDYSTLRAMVMALSHRGPDETGFYINKNLGLGQSRLSIMDPLNGRQPAVNEDGSVIVVFNGEIFNHRILRAQLQQKGHRMSNNSDTAILPHLYEEYGTAMFEKLNGQFAIAIYEKAGNRLVLARDRFGEKPLYYYHQNGVLCFGSEIKAIFQSGMVNPRISPQALKQVLTFWSTISDRSIFEQIWQVPPASYLVVENGQSRIQAYWSLSYTNRRNSNGDETAELVEELDELMTKSVTSRMMSDVPIGFYLSGGLDSSLVAAIAAKATGKRLKTFSIAFEDGRYDESEYQQLMSQKLGTYHSTVLFKSEQIPGMLPQIIAHTETPVLRTGAFPMLILAELVKSNNTKVVLSGEGSDELFGGYDIFREAKIREFCNKNPESGIRPLLFKKINHFVEGLHTQPAGSLAMYYKNGSDDWCSSHMARWRMGQYGMQFLSEEYKNELVSYDALAEIRDSIPSEFANWTKVQQAQYLEMAVFFSSYLLSSQGDRVSMASSVECRYPFLDNKVVQFASELPDSMKIRGLNEKFIVKKLAQRYLPEQITGRTKYPYRAPIDIKGLMRDEYILEMTSDRSLKEAGVFDMGATRRYLSMLQGKAAPSERDCMLFLGILTTQILADLFIGRAK